MAKEEKGFPETLLEGFANAVDMKAAVEASRDENGRVDKWKATGMAMGRGHTSAEDMATLAGILGAEGAFDGDDKTDDADDYFPDIRNDGNEEFEDTFIGANLVFADDMKLLSEAGYDEFELDLMEPEELKEAMEDAGVDTFFYDFE